MSVRGTKKNRDNYSAQQQKSPQSLEPKNAKRSCWTNSVREFQRKSDSVGPRQWCTGQLHVLESHWWETLKSKSNNEQRDPQMQIRNRHVLKNKETAPTKQNQARKTTHRRKFRRIRHCRSVMAWSAGAHGRHVSWDPVS